MIRSVLYDNKLGLSSLYTKKAWLWSSVADVERLFFMGKKRDRPITYAFCGDLHISQCCLVFYKKTCLKEGEVPQKSFSDVTLVTQGLPSSFLSCPVT